MPPRVYVETPVISYLAARPSRDLITAARQQITHDWWRRRRPDFEVFVSQLVLDEAQAGDPDAALRRADILADLPLLDITSAAVAFARRLMDAVGLPRQAAADALHIATAACHGVNYLLTWNVAQRRVSRASGTGVSRAWLRTASALYTGRIDRRGSNA